MTARARRRKRCLYLLGDRRGRVLDLTPASLAVVNERFRCAGKGCYFLSPRWHERPEPINVVVDRVTQAWVERISDIALMALDTELADALTPYCRDILFGKVLLDYGEGRPEPTRFVTITAPARSRIHSERGRHCEYSFVRCCGVFVNRIGWAKEAVVERELDDRLVYIDHVGHVLVADELVEKLELGRRFPRLWLQRVEILPEPLDGATLPGDPGWDGVPRMRYSASLSGVVYVPHSPTRDQEEGAIYAEFARRLNRELEAIGAEKVSRDRGCHGSCFFYTRGHDATALKNAVLRAVDGWSTHAHFSITLHTFDFDKEEVVEQLKIPGNAG